LFLLLPLTITLVNDSGLSLDRLRDHTALIEVKGSLSEDAPANAQRIIVGLQDACEVRRAKAVILCIDNAGGSLGQAREVRGEILWLRSKSDKPIYAVVAEQCQAAAYWLASATDRIYADKASRVCGLALRMEWFWLHEANERLGANVARAQPGRTRRSAIRFARSPRSNASSSRGCWTDSRRKSSPKSPRGGGRGWSGGPRCSAGSCGPAPRPVIWG
jgi:ClpP class serine protease